MISIAAVLVGLLGFITFTLSQSEKSREEARMYLSVFEAKPGQKDFSEQSMVMSRPSLCGAGEYHFRELPPGTVQRFVDANEDGASPIRLASLEGEIPIVSWEDTKRLNGSDDFYRFISFENHTILLLSRVGFNDARTEAVFCVETRQGKYGQADLAFAKKIDVVWKVVKEIGIWIS